MVKKKKIVSKSQKYFKKQQDYLGHVNGDVEETYSGQSIVKMFITMAQSDLGYHILITVAETLTGFLLGVVLGLAIAVAMWFSPFTSRVAAPFLVVLHSLPKIALGPVIIVWAGAGMSAIIVMAVAISLIVTVLELSGGFESTDKNLITTVQRVNILSYG